MCRRTCSPKRSGFWVSLSSNPCASEHGQLNGRRAYATKQACLQSQKAVVVVGKRRGRRATCVTLCVFLLLTLFAGGRYATRADCALSRPAPTQSVILNSNRTCASQ